MRPVLRRLFPAAAALALACGSQSLTVTMNSQNNSGEDGVATLTGTGKTTKVVLKVRRPSTGESSQPAHLHPGTCGEIGLIAFPLALLTPPSDPGNQGSKDLPADVVPDDGGWLVSISEVDAGLDPLQHGHYVINAHDQFDSALYVSCGAIE